MQLEFFGAAGQVTGSCHILTVGGRRVLLECGLIQGGRKQEQRNREPFPFAPREVDAVVLSHAHIDHSGRVPLLVKLGFKGPIFAQQATRDFCEILLEDSASLAERDADTENRKRERKGRAPVEPLYTVADARAALAQFVALPYAREHEVVPGVRIRYQDAGHIMGSAAVEVWVREGDVERKLVFSGDLGQYDTPILRDPAVIESADLVLMESTYGDRLHRERSATVAEIAEILEHADHHRGNVLIPSFAVGRSQELLYLFGKHYADWRLGRWKIFLDSPMAIRATEVYWNYPQLYDAEATKLRREHDEMPKLPNLELSQSPAESRRINQLRQGAIIIAGSGMCQGGRIVHHLKHNLWRPECQLVIVGYQAEGTLGRRLVDGAAYVRIHHETIKVRAQLHTVGGLSAHGDQDDLARWYGGFAGRPPVYLVHGEPEAAQGLKQRLTREGARSVHLAVAGETVDLASLEPRRPG